MNRLRLKFNKILIFFGFKKKRLVFSSVLLKLGEMNLNNRMYEDNENIRAAITDFNQRADRMGGVFGQLGYSENGEFDISLSKVSHSVKDVKIADNSVIGTITVLDTPCGRDLRKMIKSTVFRPRSSGRVQEDGTVDITKIFTFDAIPVKTDSFNNTNK